MRPTPKPGLTYSQRSTSAFNPKLLPAGCIFSTGGHGVFADDKSDLLPMLGVLASRIIHLQIEMAVGSGDDAHSGSAARNYLNGMINKLKAPKLDNIGVTEIRSVIEKLVEIARRKTTTDETSRLFILPQGMGGTPETLRGLADHALCTEESFDIEMIECFCRLDMFVSSGFLLTQQDRTELDAQTGKLLADFPTTRSVDVSTIRKYYEYEISEIIKRTQQTIGSSRYISKKSYVSSRRLELISRLYGVHPRVIVEARRETRTLPPGLLEGVAIDVISYCAGVAVGRWDVRYVTGERQPDVLPDTFDPFPACSPGMLRDVDGFPLIKTPGAYPLRIDWDGILVDDSNHQDDIIRRIQDVLELVCKELYDAIEKQACEILRVKDLRDYFRKPGKGGFWDDHVSRYSKSRRKAPIYWLLQSSKKNYALWMYYHRLDKDILFKALLNYVEPKIRLEESRLEPLRAQRVGAGASGKGVKKLETDIERQEEFISELRDFEDKLRRVANLHLEPDLNDGVVLNIAPLWDLVPWKEAKNYWEELLSGKYEWSSIGKQLREKGIVRDL